MKYIESHNLFLFSITLILSPLVSNSNIKWIETNVLFRNVLSDNYRKR